jgi:hypothetical protein
MDRYVNDHISRHRGKGVLVDTNLLLLFFVGRHVGLTRFREPIRVKRSGSVKGVEEDGQERQALFA